MTEESPVYGDEEAHARDATVREGDGPTLEERIRRLEQILSALENDEHTLDEALALFEEGIAHVRTSEQLLDRAMLKVEELLNAEGDVRPLDADIE